MGVDGQQICRVDFTVETWSLTPKLSDFGIRVLEG